MVVEHALLRVRDGKQAAFEAAMVEAKPLITSSPGFIDMQVRASIETTGLYLLLVRWESVADHRDGFRLSERYARWCALLHHFYDPMPEVTYFGETL